MRRFIKEALQHHLDSAADPLPEKLRIRYKLPDYKHALQTMHQPETRESLQQARRRFVYEEFLLFQLKMQAFRKAERNSQKASAMCFLLKSSPLSQTACRFRSRPHRRVCFGKLPLI